MKIKIRLDALEVSLESQDPISEEIIGLVVKILYQIRELQLAPNVKTKEE